MMAPQGQQHVHGSAADRVGRGIGEAIRRVFEPDAAADDRLDSLLEQLRSVTGTREDNEERKQ